MTRLVWDQMTDRVYETGVDRAVLYVDGVGVPWNGLISVEESPVGGNVTSYYLDGVKHLNHTQFEEYSALLEAFTYPDLFLECEGVVSVSNGLLLTQQTKKEFSLSYRTMVGNPIRGIDLGYKIHLVYGVSVNPAERTNQSIGEDIDPQSFTWELNAKPHIFAGKRPTSHFVIDSRKTPLTLLKQVEDILYGTESEEARIPSVEELVFIFEQYQVDVLDAGTLVETYFEEFDSGDISEPQTETIDGGAP